jgi:hypothetical protein
MGVDLAVVCTVTYAEAGPTATCDTALAEGRRVALRDRRPWRSYYTEAEADSGRQRLECLPRGLSSFIASANNGDATIDRSTYGANGNVLGIARLGTTLYIAGAFRSVGENLGGFAGLDGESGEVLKRLPKVAGSVYAIVPDGSGGWYIGGEFTGVGDKERSCLAQIRADGTVTDWNPSVTGSPGYTDPPWVWAIAVHDRHVFVGGGFRELGGQTHENLGCVDARTGRVLDWSLDVDETGDVMALVTKDSVVYVGGWFSEIGGASRNCLAAVDAASGQVLPWRADADARVWALATRDDTLLVAGEFDWIAGESRNFLAAVDMTTQRVLSFDAHATGIYRDYSPLPRVDALALAGDTLYVGGTFTEVGGRALPSLAALNVGTGMALEWTPPVLGPTYAGWPPQACYALQVEGGALYVGGSFSTAGGLSRPYAAAVDRTSGELADWNPRPDLPIWVFGTCARMPLNPHGFLLAGGEFSLMGEWQHRAGLAAIDLNSGRVKPWNPNPNGIVVTAIAAVGDRVFVSGDFSVIGGAPQSRRHVAAVDTLNGEVLDWNPGANAAASALLLHGDTLYAGGDFTTVGGKARYRLAAINTTTGEVTDWNPNANATVLVLAQDDSLIYAGGLFNHVGGTPRRGLAALDAVTGVVSTWDPAPDNPTIESLLLQGGVLYVGGAFSSIGGRPRSGLAAVDPFTGVAADWDPNPTSWGVVSAHIRALAAVDSLLYVGGEFGSVGGEARICLAAVDTATGRATSWDPGLNGYVWSLAAAGNSLYVGGGFTRASGVPCTGLAVYSVPEEPSGPEVTKLALSVIPNPCQGAAVVRFSLPAAGAVELGVYDLQGRKLAAVSHQGAWSAGVHSVPIPTDGWPEGVHFVRLQSGSTEVTKKLVIVR